MSVPPPDRRIDELRQQLKTLGYLDAGVNRFVLGAAHERQRPITIALVASVRIGVLGALLLGPSAAAGLGGRLPGLVTGPRDAVVIALYLAVVFGVAVAIVAFLASFIARSLMRTTGVDAGRRVGHLALTAGIAVTAASLVYLTLWWRTANFGVGWASPAWTAFALAVAAAISILLGHAVMVTALALAAAEPDAPVQMPGIPWSSRRAQLAAVAVAFVGAAVLLILTAPTEGRTRDTPPLTVISSGIRVRLYAIDGFDLTIFNALQSKSGFGDALPALTAALGGAHARLAGQDNRDPARAWTTLSTGQPPEVHGVYGVETRRVAGLQGSVVSSTPSALGRVLRAATDTVRLTRPAAASGIERRAKTLWEVASDAGLRTAVVNWWATWPARPDKGVVLSDRATLRLELGGALDAEIAPPELYDQLRAEWPAIKSQASARAQTVGVSSNPDTRAQLRRSAELDAVQMLLTAKVITPETDLACTYLPGLDLLQHELRGAAIDTSLALREYYRYVDALLANVSTPGEREIIVLLATPGREYADAPALLSLRGWAAKSGISLQGRPTDVMPTLLYALGVPISRGLAGAPLTALFEDDFVQRYPVREVATYGSPSTSAVPRGGKPLDQEMIDRLRSLGYVK